MSDYLKSLTPNLIAAVAGILAEGRGKKGKERHAKTENEWGEKETQKKNIVQRGGKREVSEEQIDEISAQKAGEYVSAVRNNSTANPKGSEYLKSKKKSIDRAYDIMKKQARNEEVEDVESAEQIDELSRDTLSNYIKANRADPAHEVKKGKVSAAKVAIRAKRAKGNETAYKKIKEIDRNESNNVDDCDTNLNEALNAGDRYKHHLETSKSLIKSINDHLKNHADAVSKAKNYKGDKGANWGHVGSMEAVAKRLGDIHDDLCRSNNYQVNEEVESLDELSKGTLGSYIKKAIPNKAGLEDSSDRNHQKGHAAYTPGNTKTSDKFLNLSQKQYDKAQKRGEGINKAVDKLAKEEVELSQEEMEKLTAIVNEFDSTPEE